MKFLAELKKAKKKLSDPWWRAKKKYITFFDKLPINDKCILIESQHGKEMSGNVFYIMRYLSSSEQYSDYTVYLSARAGKVKSFRSMLDSYGMSSIKITVLASEEYYRLMASAKYLINDNTFLPFFMKKDGQVYINTWHGTPLKTLGRKIKSDPHGIGNTQRNFVFADYITFPNDHTRDVMLRDYMIENISSGSYIMTGYPRNEVFFNDERRAEIVCEQKLEGKRIYAYMPTFRGAAAIGGTSKNSHYLNYFLYELDKKLGDDELLYVNLHPVAKKDVQFKGFKHIRNFPQKYETYDFLNACDLLVTDYSSVFFDFAASGKKVVLFTYDKDEYLADRGMYLSIDELPFPQVTNADELIMQLRAPKEYDDREFIDKFCKYESAQASQKLCDFAILNKENGTVAEPIPSNGNENVLMYCGNLAANGITVSIRSLLNNVDTSKRNYYLTFRAENVYKNRHVLSQLPDDVYYFATGDDMNLTLGEQISRKLFKNGLTRAGAYAKKFKKRIEQAFKRNYADAKFDHVIQFNGYESEVILQLLGAPCRRSIFVHNDMLNEIATRGNQRRDVLEYAYRTYDNVAIVTEDLIAPTRTLAGKDTKLTVVRNTIDYKSILEKGSLPLDSPDYASCTVSFDTLCEILNSDAHKFINIARFAPEKGQDRLISAFDKLLGDIPNSYLIIMGGNSFGDYYQRIKSKVAELGLEDRVNLIMNTPNPYRRPSKCDYFVLSSHYEGFGLVLAEADILGKPVISTDIVGPRLFMQKHGGTLVEDSEAGILDGMRMLAEGKVKPMNVDFAEYNREVVAEFESLFK